MSRIHLTLITSAHIISHSSPKCDMFLHLTLHPAQPHTSSVPQSIYKLFIITNLQISLFSNTIKNVFGNKYKIFFILSTYHSGISHSSKRLSISSGIPLREYLPLRTCYEAGYTSAKDWAFEPNAAKRGYRTSDSTHVIEHTSSDRCCVCKCIKTF